MYLIRFPDVLNKNNFVLIIFSVISTFFKNYLGQFDISKKQAKVFFFFFLCCSMNAFHIHTSQIVYRKYFLEYHVTKERAALRNVEQTKPWSYVDVELPEYLCHLTYLCVHFNTSSVRNRVKHHRTLLNAHAAFLAKRSSTQLKCLSLNSRMTAQPRS